MICPKCCSSNIERRGTRRRNDEECQRIKCFQCESWSSIPLTYREEPTFERTKDEIKSLIVKDRYIVTSAQNNTPLDRKFWSSIKNYAGHHDAQIVVIPVLYRNPTSPGELASTDAWWPPEVEPYLVQSEMRVAKGVRVMGHVKIAATAGNPLTGLETLSQHESALFGHGQIQYKTVATPQKRLPKILHTTGSTSQPNYSKSKAGVKGEHHHSLGAVVIEVDREEELVHIRGVVGDRQSEFYDIDTRWTSRGGSKMKRAEAIVLGDEHVLENCPDVKDATFLNKDSIVNVTRPKYIVRHDVIDSYSISHHHNKSPAIKYAKHLMQKDNLKMELMATAAHVKETTPKDAISVIVPSNHHNHITRWLEEIDWRTEPWNARLYHEMWTAWLTAIDAGRGFHPFTWWMMENCDAEVMYLAPDYPFVIKDIYLGYHGDRGANGAKGTIAGFSKIGAKTVTGHTHSPGIEKGAYQVGTSSVLNLDYTQGPSSWLNTHCLVFPNGKRQLINVINGKWRL